MSWSERAVHIGNAWNSKIQIDVTGMNSAELVEEKAPRIIPARGKWKVYFLGFSRGGWTSSALAYQDEINRHAVQGENWYQ